MFFSPKTINTVNKSDITGLCRQIWKMLSLLYIGSEKKFLSFLLFTFTDSHQVWEFHYKVQGRFLTLHIPKPCLSKVNHPTAPCIVVFKALLLMYTCDLHYKDKRKWNKNGGQHNTLCSLRATQGNTLWSTEQLNTLPQFFTHTDMAFLGTTALRASSAVHINFLHSIPPLPWLLSQAQHREHSIRVGF